jgi:hypothetical protein
MGSLQEPQIERPEHQDDRDVDKQALPEPMPEEQDVHAHHDHHEREHVKRDTGRRCHRFSLLRVAVPHGARPRAHAAMIFYVSIPGEGRVVPSPTRASWLVVDVLELASLLDVCMDLGPMPADGRPGGAIALERS